MTNFQHRQGDSSNIWPCSDLNFDHTNPENQSI